MAVYGIVGHTTAGARRSARPSPTSRRRRSRTSCGGTSPSASPPRTCGDITYIPTGEGWLYLADVLDLGAAGSWATPWRSTCDPSSSSMPLRWPSPPGRRRRRHGLPPRPRRPIHGPRLPGAVREHEVVQSVGRIGSSQDNAVAECFWATLKRELVSRRRFATRAEARRAIIAWINHYNVRRLHSSIGNVTPIEWELRYAHRDQLAA